MFRWCSYCQKYLGEVEPLDLYTVTHGLCPQCHAARKSITHETELERFRPVVEVHRKLRLAGHSGDYEQARAALQEAIRLRIPPIDFLMGILQPCLYELGYKWELGELSVAEEHRFTALAQSLLRIAIETQLAGEPAPPTGVARAMIFASPGNLHTLGAVFLELFLRFHSVHAVADTQPRTPAEITSVVQDARPRFVALSISLPGQLGDAIEVARTLRESLGESAPSIVVGGFAVRAGLAVPPESGLIACATVSEFLALVAN